MSAKSHNLIRRGHPSEVYYLFHSVEDDKLIIVFLFFFQSKKALMFHVNGFLGRPFAEMSRQIFLKKKNTKKQTIKTK